MEREVERIHVCTAEVSDRERRIGRARKDRQSERLGFILMSVDMREYFSLSYKQLTLRSLSLLYITSASVSKLRGGRITDP